MTSRIGLVLGGVMAALAAATFALVPASVLAGLLDVSGDAAASFLLRRYGASATAALFVVSLAALRGVSARRASLFGFATWFAGQGAVAIVGVATGVVGSLAWVATFADPLLALVFLVLARRAKGREAR